MLINLSNHPSEKWSYAKKLKLNYDENGKLTQEFYDSEPILKENPISIS